HSRILLRALTERERLDLSRRLTGSLSDASPDAHPSVEATRDPRVLALRSALAGVASLAGSRAFAPDAAAPATALAERVLRVDPSARALAEVARSLTEAASAIGASRATDAHRALDASATRLAAVLGAELPNAPTERRSSSAASLDGALTDALRRKP